MKSSEGEWREGLRLRKTEVAKVVEAEAKADQGKSSDLVSRILESTKDLTDCMPTDLPSAKQMVKRIILLLV